MSLSFKTKGEVLNYAAKVLPNVPTNAISMQIPDEPTPAGSHQYLQISFDAIQAGKLVEEYRKAKAKDDQDKIRAAVNDANARAGAYERAIREFLAYSGYNDKLYAAVIKAYSNYNDVDKNGKTFSQRTFDRISALIADMKKWMPGAEIKGDVTKLKDLPTPTGIGTDERLTGKVDTMKERYEGFKANLYGQIVNMINDVNLWALKPAATKLKERAAKLNDWTTAVNRMDSDYSELVADMRKLNAIGIGVSTRIVVGS